MARLMIVPIRKRGDSILIVTHHAATDLVGFVAQSTLAGLLRYKPPMQECVTFVQRHLPAFERILLRKSDIESAAEGSMPCVEITSADLTNENIDLTRS